MQVDISGVITGRIYVHMNKFVVRGRSGVCSAKRYIYSKDCMAALELNE